MTASITRWRSAALRFALPAVCWLDAPTKYCSDGCDEGLPVTATIENQMTAVVYVQVLIEASAASLMQTGTPQMVSEVEG